MVLVDAITRLIPGVLNNRESAEADSFYNGLLSYPQYTRPEEFEGKKVPEILTGGHHKNIMAGKKELSIAITRERRPDLWKDYFEKNPAPASGIKKTKIRRERTKKIRDPS
jgi:tRNA (guanine37-N1)-methyltransferase